MADLNIVTYNVKGLRSPSKRSQIFSLLGKEKSSIIFLQETHYKHNKYPDLSFSRFPNWYHCGADGAASRGVSIGFKKSVPFTYASHIQDPEGRYIILKGHISQKMYTFVNLYAPNSDQISWLLSTLSLIENHHEGILVLAGDLNVALHPLTDTSSKRSSFSARALRKLNAKLYNLGLIDIWRCLNPNCSDYSFFPFQHSPIAGSIISLSLRTRFSSAPTRGSEVYPFLITRLYSVPCVLHLIRVGPLFGGSMSPF